MGIYVVDKQYAHKLIEAIPPDQLLDVIRTVQQMLDPDVLRLADLELDSDFLSETEKQAVAASDAQFARGEGILFETVLADYGFTLEELERMGPELSAATEPPTPA